MIEDSIVFPSRDEEAAVVCAHRLVVDKLQSIHVISKKSSYQLAVVSIVLSQIDLVHSELIHLNGTIQVGNNSVGQGSNIGPSIFTRGLDYNEPKNLARPGLNIILPLIVGEGLTQSKRNFDHLVDSPTQVMKKTRGANSPCKDSLDLSPGEALESPKSPTSRHAKKGMRGESLKTRTRQISLKDKKNKKKKKKKKKLDAGNAYTSPEILRVSEAGISFFPNSDLMAEEAGLIMPPPPS